MTLLLTRALKRAQRDYRRLRAELEKAEQRRDLRRHQAGLGRNMLPTPDNVLIHARIAYETGYNDALHDCISAETVLLETARTFCETKGFERLAQASGLCPRRLELIFTEGPKTTRVRRELVRICLAI